MNNNQHDLSDDELDRIFSDAAEKMDFDFNPDSWTKMSQKLDAADLPAASKPWQKRALILLIGLLFLTGTYYFTKKSSTETSKNLANNKAKIAEKADSKTNISSNNITTPKTEDIKNDVLEQKTIAKSIIKSEPKTGNNSVIISKGNVENDEFSEKKANRSKTYLSNTLQSTSDVKRRESKEKNTTVLSNKKSIESYNTITKNNILEKNNPQISTTEKSVSFENSTKFRIAEGYVNNIIETPIAEKEISNRFIISDIHELSPKGIFIQSKFNLPAIVFENKVVVQTNIPQSKSTAFKKGLYLRVATSPDLSLITMHDMTKPGSDWAALLEYRFNNRLSIHSGIIRSMKYYDATPESYQWPADWKQPPALININASCKMLDIPLNVRYDITQKTKNRLFISTGITSYVMLNEKYVYNYENPADPAIKWKNWEGKTGMYKLSTINFSSGYEYQAFRKLSLQIEPFVKVPVSKVGFGKVNLSTIGVFISAKYPLK